jgi:hypothetical protein
MPVEVSPTSEQMKPHWMPAGVTVAFLALLAIAGAFAAFAFASIDLRITIVVAMVTGIAATAAVNVRTQDAARLAAWLGVLIGVAFLLAGTIQGLWNSPSTMLVLIDTGLGAFFTLISIRFLMVVSRRVSLE